MQNILLLIDEKSKEPSISALVVRHNSAILPQLYSSDQVQLDKCYERVFL